MKETKLSDLNILDVGNTIQLSGAIYSGNGKVYLIPLPDENPDDLRGDVEILTMTDAEMERFLNQTDVLDVQSQSHSRKAILRKSQRQIDQILSWKVFRRDNYACRYCGKSWVPLTVDHADLWEDGGATIEDNLLSACRKCNKTRGNVPYPEWIDSQQYALSSEHVADFVKKANLALVGDMARLMSLRIKKRSR
jgi:hypothetical protein